MAILEWLCLSKNRQIDELNSLIISKCKEKNIPEEEYSKLTFDIPNFSKKVKK